MIMNYETHGIKILAKELPKSCTACPFWGLDELAEFGICSITYHEIRADEKSDSERMDDCPIEKEEDNAGWIPVDERLPPKTGDYMACIHNVKYDSYRFKQTQFIHESDYGIDKSEWTGLLTFEEVTAWTPLPKPYTKKG